MKNLLLSCRLNVNFIGCNLKIPIVTMSVIGLVPVGMFMICLDPKFYMPISSGFLRVVIATEHRIVFLPDSLFVKQHGIVGAKKHCPNYTKSVCYEV
jgi:hypothetical protein